LLCGEAVALELVLRGIDDELDGLSVEVGAALADLVLRVVEVQALRIVARAVIWMW
jgi:hypothetical protein